MNIKMVNKMNLEMAVKAKQGEVTYNTATTCNCPIGTCACKNGEIYLAEAKAEEAVNECTCQSEACTCGCRN